MSYRYRKKESILIGVILSDEVEIVEEEIVENNLLEDTPSVEVDSNSFKIKKEKKKRIYKVNNNKNNRKDRDMIKNYNNNSGW